MAKTKATAAYPQEAFRIAQEVARSGRGISDLPFLPTFDERQVEKDGFECEPDQIRDRVQNCPTGRIRTMKWLGECVQRTCRRHQE
jgi:hypothetical protein